MIDTLSKQQRSWVMSRVRGQHTKPEVLVRMLLHRRGLRFRLGGRGLPGKPDIVLPKYRTVVFVHGCFWHLHRGCKNARMPSSNRNYWKKKLEANRARDKSNRSALKKAGWRVVTVWECAIMKRPNKVIDGILLALEIRKKTFYALSMPDSMALKVAEKRSRYLLAESERKKTKAS